MRYIVIIIMLAIAVSVAGYDMRAFNYGAEKLDHGYVVENADFGFHVRWDSLSENPEACDGEYSKYPEWGEDGCWDGPFGWDAESYTDLSRKGIILNTYCPNRWWDSGNASSPPFAVSNYWHRKHTCCQ